MSNHDRCKVIVVTASLLISLSAQASTYCGISWNNAHNLMLADGTQSGWTVSEYKSEVSTNQLWDEAQCLCIQATPDTDRHILAEIVSIKSKPMKACTNDKNIMHHHRGILQEFGIL